MLTSQGAMSSLHIRALCVQVSCLGCVVLLCFVVCLTLLPSFLLPSASLINRYVKERCRRKEDKRKQGALTSLYKPRVMSILHKNFTCTWHAGMICTTTGANCTAHSPHTSLKARAALEARLALVRLSRMMGRTACRRSG